MANYQVVHGRVIDQNGNVGVLYSHSAGYIQDKRSYCSDNDSVDGLYDDRSVWSTDPDTGLNDVMKLFCPPLVLYLANGGKLGELLGKNFEKHHQVLSKKGKLVLNGALPNLNALDRVALAWIPANSRFKVSIKANEEGGLEEFIEYYDPAKWYDT